MSNWSRKLKRTGNSGFEQVGANNTGLVTVHNKTGLPIDKNGYLYVYVSNETPNIDVYFDNLQVTHVRGRELEETHYYPFGLTMAGITSKALNFGDPINKKNKFQNQELDADLGVDIYEFKYRMDDPQIGRFWQTDPLSDKYVYNSLYAFSENKVIAYVELEGLEAVIAIKNKQIAKKIESEGLKGNIDESERLVWVAVSKGDATFTADPNGGEGFGAYDASKKDYGVLGVQDGIVRTTPKNPWVKGGVDKELMDEIGSVITSYDVDIDKIQDKIDEAQREYDIVHANREDQGQQASPGEPHAGHDVGRLIRVSILLRTIEKYKEQQQELREKRDELQKNVDKLEKQEDEASRKSQGTINY